jgi:hypothetical protein
MFVLRRSRGRAVAAPEPPRRNEDAIGNTLPSSRRTNIEVFNLTPRRTPLDVLRTLREVAPEE